jgi:Protein of unknown function (DUF3748)
MPEQFPQQRQLTEYPGNHLLTNIGVWSPDAHWLVYDTRTSLDGSVFDGLTIERVNVHSGRVEQLYRATAGAHCGVATYHPILDQVVFILGPEHPTADWQYGPAHRQGVLVDCTRPNLARNLDARNLVAPFTPGALRGGTHVHTFSPDGSLVASTYEDAVLQQQAAEKAYDTLAETSQKNLRGVAVSLVGNPVTVPQTHCRNHCGEAFTVLATRLHDQPQPGSDQISRACEEGWIGVNGYLRADGTRQSRALAFQGSVVAETGAPLVEAFVLDLPEQPLKLVGTNPELAGTSTTRPQPPAAVQQRRLTFTSNRRFPGLSGPRHWLRSSPDGSSIAFLAKAEDGTVQLFSVDPGQAQVRQITQGVHSVSSAFSFSPCGNLIACVADSSVFIAEVHSNHMRRLTPRDASCPPRAEACVFSPCGQRVAFMRTLRNAGGEFNQLFTVEVL